MRVSRGWWTAASRTTPSAALVRDLRKSLPILRSALPTCADRLRAAICFYRLAITLELGDNNNNRKIQLAETTTTRSRHTGKPEIWERMVLARIMCQPGEESRGDGTHAGVEEAAHLSSIKVGRRVSLCCELRCVCSFRGMLRRDSR